MTDIRIPLAYIFIYLNGFNLRGCFETLSVHAKRTLINTAMAGFEALFLFGYKPRCDISPSAYKPS